MAATRRRTDQMDSEIGAEAEMVGGNTMRRNQHGPGSHRQLSNRGRSFKQTLSSTVRPSHQRSFRQEVTMEEALSLRRTDWPTCMDHQEGTRREGRGIAWEVGSSSDEDELLAQAKLMDKGANQGVFDKVKRKLAERKARNMRLVKGEALEKLKQRRRKKQSIVSFVLYLIFILVYFGVALGQVRVSDMYTLQSALKDYITTKGTNNIGFETISSMDQMWTWMQSTLLNLLYPEEIWYNGDPRPVVQQGFLLEFNKLIGGFRLKQRRVVVNGADCVSTEQFQNIYPTCYPTDIASTATFPFGPSYEPTKYFWVDDPSGGGYPISIPATVDARALALNILSELKTDLWTDRSTRDVYFDFLVYNGNYRMFSMVSAVLHFLPTGLVSQDIKFYTFRMEMYSTNTDLVRAAFEIVILVFVLLNFWNELREMFLDNRDKSTILQRVQNYFMSFWNWVNVALLLTLFFIIGQYLQMVFSPSHTGLTLEGEQLTQEQYNIVLGYGIQWKRYLELNSACVLLFLFTVFKFIAESAEYGVLVRTITRSAPNLVKFLIVFVVIACAFTTMGLLLFGSTVREWSSLWEAGQQFTVMLAENSGYELIKGTSVVAFVFYFMFVFIVFFILVNIILAVLMDSYAALQIELEKSRQDTVDSERVEYSVGVELLGQIIRSPPLRRICRPFYEGHAEFLTSKQMVDMVEDDRLAVHCKLRYPEPTIFNPYPEPLEIFFLSDLEKVHGRDHALFIMNQLGQLSIEYEPGTAAVSEWSQKNIEKLMDEDGDEDLTFGLDEPETPKRPTRIVEETTSEMAAVMAQLEEMSKTNEMMTATMREMSTFIAQVQPGLSLPGRTEANFLGVGSPASGTSRGSIGR